MTLRLGGGAGNSSITDTASSTSHSILRSLWSTQTLDSVWGIKVNGCRSGSRGSPLCGQAPQGLNLPCSRVCQCLSGAQHTVGAQRVCRWLMSDR